MTHHHHHHGDGASHSHTHGVVDATIATTSRGIWAIKWSFVGLTVTAVIQIFIVALTDSVSLLADTIHNVGDAMTAVPLWIAFLFARRAASRRFNYGLGRVEDLAGAAIVLVIAFSAAVAGWQSVERLINPREIHFIGAVAAGGAIGFLGNEAVAVFRIRVGREINSAALIADGQHARVDGLTSLAVLIGAVAVWAGFPLADPIAGLIITVVIAKIVVDSAKSVFGRMLDGVDPDALDEIEHLASHVAGSNIPIRARARWIGHRLQIEVRIDTASEQSVAAASELEQRVAAEIRSQISHAGEILVIARPPVRANE
jgi:cation diffusion facilitator family transporter